MRPSPSARTLTLAVAILVFAAIGEWYLAAVHGGSEVTCRPLSAIAPLPELREASGLALSRRTPGVLWSMNDSGVPAVFALDPHGAVRGRVRISGAMAHDWEDVSIGRCPRGNCLYIADIGDNDQRRASIDVYRIPEPAPSDAVSAPAEVFRAVYPDGPHDAEALFVSPEGGLYVITKDKIAAEYRFPETLQTGVTMMLQQVAMLPLDHVTDAETSVDGRWVAVRTREAVAFYHIQEITSGLPSEGSVVSVANVREPQGEGVAMAADGTVYLAGEGGGHHQPGTIASIACRLPQH